VDRMPGYPRPQACSRWRTCWKAANPGQCALKRSQSCRAWRTNCAGSAISSCITVRTRRRLAGWRTGDPGPSTPVSPIQRSTLLNLLRRRA